MKYLLTIVSSWQQLDRKEKETLISGDWEESFTSIGLPSSVYHQNDQILLKVWSAQLNIWGLILRNFNSVFPPLCRFWFFTLITIFLACASCTQYCQASQMSGYCLLLASSQPEYLQTIARWELGFWKVRNHWH